jgi:hypothetical protein
MTLRKVVRSNGIEVREIPLFSKKSFKIQTFRMSSFLRETPIFWVSGRGDRVELDS